jgi:hypothetical protein
MYRQSKNNVDFSMSSEQTPMRSYVSKSEPQFVPQDMEMAPRSSFENPNVNSSENFKLTFDPELIRAAPRTNYGESNNNSSDYQLTFDEGPQRMAPSTREPGKLTPRKREEQARKLMEFYKQNPNGYMYATDYFSDEEPEQMYAPSRFDRY